MPPAASIHTDLVGYLAEQDSYEHQQLLLQLTAIKMTTFQR
jgi:hypothetical protein